MRSVNTENGGNGFLYRTTRFFSDGMEMEPPETEMICEECGVSICHDERCGDCGNFPAEYEPCENCECTCSTEDEMEEREDRAWNQCREQTQDEQSYGSKEEK